MEKQKQQQQRDQAKKQQQQQKVNSEGESGNSGAASALAVSKPASSIVHLDPIQSIANVLNHHHLEQQQSKQNKQQQQQQNQWQQVSTEGKNFVSVLAAVTATTTNEGAADTTRQLDRGLVLDSSSKGEESVVELSRGPQKRAGAAGHRVVKSAVLGQVDQATGRPVLLKVDNKRSNGKKPAPPLLGKTKANLVELEGGVDITTSATTTTKNKSASELAGLEREPGGGNDNDQLAADSVAFKRQLASGGADLVAARELAREASSSSTTSTSKTATATTNITTTNKERQNSADYYKCAQVDQGNSYLYAYNDFITPSAHLSSSNQIHGSGGPASREQAAALKVSDEQKEKLDEEHDLRIARPNQQTNGHQIRSSAKRESSASELLRKSPLEQAQALGLLPGAPQLSLTKDKSEGNNNNITTRSPEELFAKSKGKDFRGTHIESNQLVVTSSGEGRKQNREEVDNNYEDDYEGEREEEEDFGEEDEGEETLSYILNQHIPLVAQQQQQQLIIAADSKQHSQECNLLHLNQFDASIGQLPAHLVCRHQLALVENPNHLRQYLQIEENFNNYKAARHKSTRRGGVGVAGPQAINSVPVPLSLPLPVTATIAASQQQQASVSVYQERAQLLGANDEQCQAEQIQANCNNKHLSSSSFLPLQSQQTSTTPATSANYHHHHHHNQQANLSSSSLSSSLSSLANLTTGNAGQLNQVSLHQDKSNSNHHHTTHRHHQPPPGGLLASPRSYLQFLTRFAPLSFGSASSQQQQQQQGNAHRKMYSASQQVGQLAGQAGAYYVTTSTVSNGDRQQQQDNGISQAHLSHTQIQQQHTMMNGNHPANQHHLDHHHHHHHHHSNNNNQHQQQLHMPQSARAHTQHHHQQLNHLHHNHNQQHSYPVTSVTSDSSLGSSGAFATSAVRRTTSWLRDFCSKRCLFVTCLMLIVFIFILVISLSAYLNFLISANKVNLQPLSGRLRVMLDTMRAPDEGGGGRDDSQLPAGQTATTTTAQSLRQLMMMMAPTNNSSSSQVKMATSQEFLQKQRDFETILRGALDRTQPMLKTYPNHLVKLEVYSFKPVQPQQQPQAANDLWVYFRLFVNKRSLQLDGQLMKRKSPDEQFDKQFLPRLTQQTLLNGFEQLITSFGPAAAAATANNADQPPSVTGGTGARVALVNGKPVVADQTTATDSSYTSAAQQLGINSRRFGHQQQAADSAPSWSNRRPSRAIAAASAPLQHRFASSQSPSTSSSSSSTNKSPLSANQQQQLKSFDEQISRLMHLIEAIDLQSIFVTPEFDMIQTMQQQQPSTSQIMSETLKANRPMIQTTTTTTTSTTTTNTSQPPTSRDNNGNNNNNNGNIVMVASGSGGDQYEYQDSNSNNNNNNNNKLSSTTSLKEKQLTTRQPPPRPSELEVEEEDISNNNNEDEPPSSRKPERKFTLNQNYRENSTRPSLGGSSASTTSSTPTTSLPPRAQPKDSLFLLNHQQKPAPQKQPTRAQQQQSSQQANQAVVKLVSGQPVVSQSGQTISVGDKLATSTQATIIGGSGRQAMKSPPAANGPFAPLPKVDQQRQHNSSNQTPARNAAGVNNLAPVTTNRATFASTSTSTTTNRPIIINNNNSPTLSASTTTSTSPISIPELWQNTFSSGKQNGSSSTPTEISNNNVDSSEVPNGGGVNGARPRLITVTTIGSSNNNNSIASSQRQLAATASQSGADGRPHLSASEWEKISVLEIPPVSSNSLATMRAPQLNAPSSSASSSTTLTPPTSSSSTTQSSSSKPPKVAPHLNYAGSLVSTSGSNGGQGQQQKPQRQQQLGSAVVLNRDLSGGNNNSTSLTRSNGNNNNNNEGQQQQSKPQQRLHSHKPLKQQRPGSNDASHTAATAGHSRSASLNQRTNSTRSSAQGQQPKPTKIKKVVSSGESGKNQTATGDGAGSSASSPKPPPSQTATTNGKGIRIVDNFLASIGSAEQQQQQQAAAANKTSASVAQSTRQKQQESSAQQQQALLPTLPTTIELTRSTTALPPSRTTPTLFEAPQAGSKPAPRLQQPSVDGGSSRGGSGGDAIESGFVIASQQARPGTTSFSGQWRPLASGSSSQAASSGGEPGGGLEAGVNLDERDFWSAANRTTSSNGNGIVSTQRPRGGPSMPKPTMANFSLIVATERLPATLNQATGSQSPFSMPGSVMSQPLQQQQPQVINRFGPSQTSGLGVTGAPPRTTPPTNDFESHRVSRMRQSQAHSHRATDHINPFGASSMSSTTTSSSMNLIDSLSSSSTPPNTRIVDDFMITTTSSSAGRNQDSLDSGGRATTLLPPLVLSGLQGSAPMVAAAHQRSRLQPDGGGTPSIALVVSQGPKRTRGPFAFETLRSFAPVSSSLAPPDASSATIETSSESIANPSEPVAPDSFEVSEPAATTSIRAERSSAERQSSENSLRQQQHDNYQQAKDQNLDNDDGVEPLPIVVEQEKLLRKRLFVDSEPGMRMAGSRISGSDTVSAAIGGATSTSRLDEDDLSILPSTSSPLASQFNKNNNDEEDLKYQPSGAARFGNRFSRLQAQQLANATRRSQQQHQHQLLHNNRCLYFGCLARGSGEFVCLNSSQICDDSIDCQDESDELDCVSLLKLEPKTDRMGFSNGAGIIYLNRRGSLAPMCLDYFGPTTAAKTEQQPQTNGGQALTNSARQLDELVKQINAIGQYACSLQSFSRLVSVKINHHDLVDGSNQIRSSRVFHRLTVTETVAGSGADNENNQRQKDTVSSSSSPFSGQQSKSLDSLGPSNARYQVSISTSSECPSQRTVFVKCGGFECGQDSFGAPSSGEIPAGLGRDEPSSSVSSSSASLAKASLDSRRSTRDSLIMNDFPWLVKLYHFNSLACLGYLIDESWLIAASECFQATNSNTNDDLTQVKAAAASAAWSPGEWTAEISYEHYGNDDYRSIETNRRGVKDVIVPPPPSSASSITSSQASDGHTTTNGLFASGSGNLASHGSASPPIVLAKLERPVRFSPLNRPICLPASASQTKNRTNNNNNTNSDFIRTTATNYKDCLTASLPLAAANRHGSNLDSPTAANYLHGLQSPTQQQQHNHHHHLQDHQHYNNQKQQPGLVLNKVELTKAADCFQQDPKEQVRSEQVRNLICANELGEANQPSGRGGSSDDDTNGSSSSLPSSPPSKQEDAATRVLICSQQSITPNSQQLDSSSKLRSKWVVVGVQFKQGHEDDQLPAVRAGRQLFASVSSQIDWIVDTMDPKSVSSAGDGSNGNDDGRANPHRSMLFNNNYNNNNNNNDSSPADYTNTPFHLRLSSNSGAGEHTNELNPLFNNNNQQKTCSRFRCSSGECLSWSRICDGLYDCSSHDDEKDCHK